MKLTEFVDYHVPALERDQVQHNLILGVLARALSRPDFGLLTWTLGAPGECAVKSPGYAIILGSLSRQQCRELAEQTSGLSYPGVVGGTDTALWFAEHAEELGITFAERIPQHIQVLKPGFRVPNVTGFARQASSNDFELFRSWIRAFHSEAIPHDPVPSDEALHSTLSESRHWLWVLDNDPVSMAAIGRRTKNAAVINAVFTPVERRNRGFAAAVTAAVAQRIFDQGRETACLYTDKRNLASNRCYAKLGFSPMYDSWHIRRANDGPAGAQL